MAHVNDMTSDGGDALALISLESTRTGAFLSARTEARGGQSSEAQATGGRGHASSYAIGAGWTESSAEATGGFNSRGMHGAAVAEAVAISTFQYGVANARAVSTSASDRADALATSEARSGGYAASFTLADGTSGNAIAQARSAETRGQTISASAQASVSGETGSISSATAQPAPLALLPDVSALNYSIAAFSFAAGEVASDLVAEQLAPGSSVRSALENHSMGAVVGHGSMGASYGPFAQSMQSYTASAMFEFNLESSSEITLGLIDFNGRSSGDSFSLHFLVTSFGGTILERSFSDLSEAEAWFSDQTISLGEYSGPAQFALQLTLSGAIDQGAGFRYVLASSTAPVPEPAAATLMLGGLGILGLLKRRRRT